MLLSVFAQAFGGTTRQQFAAAAAAGFEGVELRDQVDGVPLTQLTEVGFSEVCAAAADEGLLVATLALGAVDQHRGDRDGLRRLGELSVLTGARIRLFSSPRPRVAELREAWCPPPEPLYYEDLHALRQCVEAIHDSNPLALVMVEAEPTSVCNTAELQARLLDDLDLPHVGLNWDFVNCWMAGEHPWPGAWRHVAQRLYGIHYKGAIADPHEPEHYAAQALPGDDDLAHGSLWATLATVGFDGPVTVDPCYAAFAPRDRFIPEPPNPNWEVAVRTVARLREYRHRAWER